MESKQNPQPHPKQLNPGQNDQFGNEVVIKKNEGIAEQGNEWADMEGINTTGNAVLEQKAEKYIRESGDIEDLPGEEDEEEAEGIIRKESSKTNNIADDDDGENSGDVIEDKEDYVPGYDLGRNKVQ